MPRKFFQRFMPDPNKIKNNKSLSIFGELLHEPNLWHLNRRSIAGAFAVGLFFAWWPVPFQMVLAVAGSILFRTNLPLSAALVWVTNPITMPVMFYFSYVVGTWIIGVPEIAFEIELTIDWLLTGLSAIWQPFLTGCLVLAVISSAIGYASIQILWRISISRRRALRNNR